MNDGADNKIKKNIDKVLMTKAINKIHDIVETEKKQEKSDKLHILFIVSAFIVALLVTVVIFSIIDV